MASFFTLPSLYMDFDGQRRAETYFELIITASSIVGFVVGFYLQMFSITVISLAGGFLLAALIAIPPWPMYRRKPLRWQKHIPFGDANNANANSVASAGGDSTAKASNKKSGSGKGGKKNN